MLLRPHDFPAHRTVFNQALAAGSFRGSFFGSGHSAASAFLRHLNFSYFYVFIRVSGAATIPFAAVLFCTP